MVQAVLLVGFQESEVQVFRGIMLDMEADMVKVSQRCMLVDMLLLQRSSLQAS